MHNLIIYIGTCARDLPQYFALVNSIRAYNVDNIPVYTCVKDEDYDQFVSMFSSHDITFIKDSDVYDTPVTNPWYKQQLIKMNFWKKKLAKNVLQMDSDSFFIRNFRVSDFLVNDDVPYTILHEHKELKEFFARHNLHDSKRNDNGDKKISQGFAAASDSIKKLFGTDYRTADYDFGHTPLIINTKVWEILEEKLIKPNNLTYESLLEYAGNDQQWYGETTLAFQTHPIFPKENLFKVFHYPENLTEFLATDKLSDLPYNYFGICLQSNWCQAGTEQFKKVYGEFFTDTLIPKMFNSQYGEDQWILENLNLPTNGVVVDVGADQPVFGSNTYFFERVMNWNGISIDADERVIDKLKQFRKNVIHAMVSDHEGVERFTQTVEAGISHVNPNGNVEVPCKTLNSILEEHNISEITLLDIDVEGHELQVCNGLDWNKYKPYIVVIEYVSPIGGNISRQITDFFTQLGNYKLVHTTQSNLIYVRE